MLFLWVSAKDVCSYLRPYAFCKADVQGCISSLLRYLVIGRPPLNCLLAIANLLQDVNRTSGLVCAGAASKAGRGWGTDLDQEPPWWLCLQVCHQATQGRLCSSKTTHWYVCCCSRASREQVLPCKTRTIYICFIAHDAHPHDSHPVVRAIAVHIADTIRHV